MTRTLFIGGPLDGETRLADPPRRVDFRASEAREDNSYLLWSYDAHLFAVGKDVVPVYVVNGLNMDLAEQKVFEILGSRT